uniref:Uncharacterized protein n=1 Tax=Anguilla anguilla TaxID=7936 RepID=A0A0E9U5B4_ANGAN
MLRAGMFQKQ